MCQVMPSNQQKWCSRVYRTSNLVEGLKLAPMDLLKANVLDNVRLEDQLAVSNRWEVVFRSCDCVMSLQAHLLNYAGTSDETTNVIIFKTTVLFSCSI